MQGDAESGRSTTTRNPKPESIQLALITGHLAWIEVGGFWPRITINFHVLMANHVLPVIYMSICTWLLIVDYNDVYDVKRVHNGDLGWIESWTTRTELLDD